jgi:fatty acid desaturase
MKLNVGGMDRILRIVVGLVLIALAATGTVGWWGWLGVIPLLTGGALLPAVFVGRTQHLSAEDRQIGVGSQPGQQFSAAVDRAVL